MCIEKGSISSPQVNQPILLQFEGYVYIVYFLNVNSSLNHHLGNMFVTFLSKDLNQNPVIVFVFTAQN